VANLTDAGIDELFDSVVSHALSLGYFDSVNTHEPKNKPGRAITCAVWTEYLGPVPNFSGLAVTSALLVLNVRIYTPFRQEPADMIDPDVMKAVNALMGAYSGNFNLGLLDDFCTIDLLGITGRQLAAQAGYLELNRSIYRVMTITFPIIIDDAWVQAK